MSLRTIHPELKDHPRPNPDLLDLLSSGEPPAFASDESDRIVFWNRGAQRILGKSADDTIGRKCFDVMGARDIFGNRFCYEQCAVSSAVRRNEPVHGYEVRLPWLPPAKSSIGVTILRIPGSRRGLHTIVHILQHIDEASRLARLLDKLGAVPAMPGTGAPRPPALAAIAPPPPLTPREKEILRWIAAGLQNKEIAQRISISVATVRNHIRNILSKLEVHSKLEAVSLAFRSGWVDEREATDRPN